MCPSAKHPLSIGTRRLILVMTALVLSACDEGMGPDLQKRGVDPGPGCTASANLNASDFGCGLVQSTGISQVDALLAQEVPRMRSFFAVNPSFGYYDECDPANMNARASPKGFIIFGRYLAETFWSQSNGSTLPHNAILAHEFGHAHQYANGWTYASGRSQELEADAWSGFYGALQKFWSGQDMNLYYQTMLELGDFNFNSPSHHGTPVQRFAASGLGLAAALVAVQQNFTPTPNQLHALFIDRIEHCIVQSNDPSPCLNLSSFGSNVDSQLRAMAAALDNELIAGIARGTRLITEIPAPPAASATKILDAWNRRSLQGS